MKPANTKLWTAIGAIVGAFLMPSTWFLLILVTAGATIADNLPGNTQGDSGELQVNPNTGEFELAPPESDPAGASIWSMKWVLVATVVAAVVTVLSAVFFGWVGNRLAKKHEQLDLLAAVGNQAADLYMRKGLE